MHVRNRFTGARPGGHVSISSHAEPEFYRLFAFKAQTHQLAWLWEGKKALQSLFSTGGVGLRLLHVPPTQHRKGQEEMKCTCQQSRSRSSSSAKPLCWGRARRRDALLCPFSEKLCISWASWTRRKLGTWKFTAPSLRAVWYTGKSLNVTKLTLKLVKPGQQYCKFLKGYYVTLIKDALSKKQLISLKTMAILFPSVKIIVFLEICPPSDSFSRLIRSLEQTTLSILS